MQITKTLDLKNRQEWRNWLEKNHDKEKEIWIIYYRKSSGKPRIPYRDCLEEALCYGWIDGILKTIDSEKYCQRFSPRRKTSNLSVINTEIVRRMIKEGKMTKFGLDAIAHRYNHKKDKKQSKTFTIPKDILDAIKSNKEAWKYFEKLPLSYKRVRISAIENYRTYNLELFKRKLDYFIKMTAKGKKFGIMVD